MALEKVECLVFTHFWPTQPGFSIFQYRISSIVSKYKAKVISNVERVKNEFGLSEEEFVYVPREVGMYGDYRFLRKMQQMIDEYSPECVLLLDSKMSIFIPFLRHKKIILFWDEHPTHWCATSHLKINCGRYYKNKLYYKLAYMGARAAVAVMPVSEAMADDLVVNGCRNSSIKYIPLGVDDSYVPNALNESPISRPINIIYIGAVKEFRGRDIILKALSQINRGAEKYLLTIVGASNEDKIECLKRADKYGATEWLTMIDRVPGCEIPKLLHQHDVGISIIEDQEYWKYNPVTKLYEYLAAGLPVIANNIETQKRYLNNLIDSIMVDYSVESLVLGLEQLWEDRDKLPDMAQAAKGAGGKYLWSNLEKEFLNVISE